MALDEKDFDTSWVSIEKHIKNVAKYDVRIVLTKLKKEDIHKRKLTFRLRKDFANRLGWSLGDRVCIYHHPDNVFLLKLIKADSNNGFKISKNNEEDYVFITMTWQDPQNVTLEGIETHTPNFKIYKGALIININE